MTFVRIYAKAYSLLQCRTLIPFSNRDSECHSAISVCLAPTCIVHSKRGILPIHKSMPSTRWVTATLTCVLFFIFANFDPKGHHFSPYA
jgi:hypothetical protein